VPYLFFHTDTTLNEGSTAAAVVSGAGASLDCWACSGAAEAALVMERKKMGNLKRVQPQRKIPPHCVFTLF